MSIYATIWELKVPKRGGWADGPHDYVEVYAQAVPPHIGHPADYPEGDPYGDFLPPPVGLDKDYPLGPPYRAVFICAPWTNKGTERSGQEYTDYLLMLTGEEYETARWCDLLDRIFEAVQAEWPRHLKETCPDCGGAVRSRARGKETGHRCLDCGRRWKVIDLVDDWGRQGERMPCKRKQQAT